MLTTAELAQAVLLPAIVALVLALGARRRGWEWAIPVSIAAGFVAGCLASRGMPGLPPRDGTDWLVWFAPWLAPLVCGVIANAGRYHPWKLVAVLAVISLCVGIVASGIAMPLQRAGGISGASLLACTLAFAAGAVVLAFVARIAAARVGAPTLLAGMAVAAGATGVVVLSSNLRVVGIYGLAAAAAIGGTTVGLLGMRRPVPMFAATASALYAAAIIAGLLSGGHYYPDPGVSWGTVAVLFASPLLLLVGAILPTRRRWVRSTVALLAVAVAAAAIAAPIALKAKKAAEEDPYAAYR